MNTIGRIHPNVVWGLLTGLTLAGAGLLASCSEEVGSMSAREGRHARGTPADPEAAGQDVDLAGGKYEQAAFAAGCFWGVEAAFRRVEGVVKTTVGYSGGYYPNPTYEDVCSGRTGHAETVHVVYDPAKVSYEDLLKVFFTCHDPTQRNRQGPDVGAQYRSEIFYYTPGQETAARAAKKMYQSRFSRPIATEITEASAFYRAEEYHQRYLEKHGEASCSSTVR